MEEELKEFASLVKFAISVERRELKAASELVDYVINYKCKDNKLVGQVFDKLLSLMFSPREDIEPIYCRLLEYVKTYDPKMSEDYAIYFRDSFEEDIRAKK